MKTLPANTALLICAMLGSGLIRAQTPPAVVPVPAGQPAVAPDLKPMTDALQIRTAMAASVASGLENSDSALARLRQQASPSGLRIDADADFAFAVLDLGQRLIAGNKPTEAEQFFRAAEQSLTAVIQRTPDKAAPDKAQYLGARANVRARYLNEPAAAKTDIDAAIQLQPDNAYYKQLRLSLASERAEFFKDTARN